MTTCLQKCKESFVFMKTIALTPIFTNQASKEGRGFVTPRQHRQGGHPASAGGFYFGLIACMGDIQPKEVSVANMGINFHSHRSKIFNQVFIQ
jgi:hypothetical protein